MTTNVWPQKDNVGSTLPDPVLILKNNFSEMKILFRYSIIIIML